MKAINASDMGNAVVHPPQPGKVAIVTGANTGLGKATVAALLKVCVMMICLLVVGCSRPHRHRCAWCWLCGTRQPTSLMVADGGSGCPDIRWYCQAIDRCTARWTEQRAIRRSELSHRT